MKSILKRPSLQPNRFNLEQRRAFHDYFVTHLPSSSLHPDSKSSVGPNHHRLPRADSTPHSIGASQRSPSALPGGPAAASAARETTVVRIPLKSAKHHFGASNIRGSRAYNEDKFQAGTIELPAFAKRQPVSVSRKPPGLQSENRQAQSASGDPQVFYFGVFDGHGGEECSNFLRDRLHGYVEDAAQKFEMRSALREEEETEAADGGKIQEERVKRGVDLETKLIASWKQLVGGYFKRFQPDYFTATNGKAPSGTSASTSETSSEPLSIEAMLTFAFLNADLDFTKAQASKHSPSARADDPVLGDKPLNETDILSHPLRPASQNLTTLLNAPIGGNTRFKGGSTASIALVSTPTPMPFWNPASPSTIVAAHVGDTRILLCRVSDGSAIPLTSNHHPSTPVEATRLRRYAASFITDSFGEERMLGLANTRAFGDVGSKRIGVSAEPQITTVQLAPSEYSFLVLMSDGISGVLSDQEIVDIIKEARTPEQASRDVTSFAAEVAAEDADNCTCIVVRLGGWERRSEGGEGSLGTKEKRDFRRRDAEDPRSRRQ